MPSSSPGPPLGTGAGMDRPFAAAGELQLHVHVSSTSEKEEAKGGVIRKSASVIATELGAGAEGPRHSAGGTYETYSGMRGNY